MKRELYKTYFVKWDKTVLIQTINTDSYTWIKKGIEEKKLLINGFSLKIVKTNQNVFPGEIIGLNNKGDYIKIEEYFDIKKAKDIMFQGFSCKAVGFTKEEFIFFSHKDHTFKDENGYWWEEGIRLHETDPIFEDEKWYVTSMFLKE